MTDFEKTYQNYNPRQAALDEARALLTAADSRQQADRRQGHCNKFLFHHHMKVPPVLK